MAITFGATASGTSDNVSHSTRTISISVTSGQLVVVSGTFGDNGSRDNTITCTDNLSTPTVYKLQLYSYDKNNSQAFWTFWGIATATGTATITIADGGGGTTFWRSFAQTYNGSFPAAPVDALSSNQQSFTAVANNITSRAKLTVNNGDLIHASAGDDSSGSSTFTAGSGFTLRAQAGAMGCEDQIQSAAGSIAATFTSNTTGTNVVVHMVCFSETASLGGSGNPSMYADFENSTDGTTLTTAILTSGIHNLDFEGWSAGTGSPFTAMKVATAAEKPLLQQLTLVDGSAFSDASSTRGVTFDVSVSASQYAALSWDMRSPVATASFWFRSGIPISDVGHYAMLWISPATVSTDFLSIMLEQGGSGSMEMKPHTFSGAGNDSGSNLVVVQNKWYWITMRYSANQSGDLSHRVTVYDDTGVLLASMTRARNTVGDTALPSTFRLGRVGDSGTPSALISLDDLVINSIDGVFPVPPIASSDVITRSDQWQIVIG